MGTYEIVRRHQVSCGHRVYAHDGACKHLHGHSYTVHFYCRATELNELGMVIDFSMIKQLLCKWLDDNFDHRMLIWQEDPLGPKLQELDSSVILVPFNPTAENIARYLCEVVAPKQLSGQPVQVYKVMVEETSNCKASYSYD